MLFFNSRTSASFKQYTYLAFAIALACTTIRPTKSGHQRVPYTTRLSMIPKKNDWIQFDLIGSSHIQVDNTAIFWVQTFFSGTRVFGKRKTHMLAYYLLIQSIREKRTKNYLIE